jgi:hypothetical protein
MNTLEVETCSVSHKDVLLKRIAHGRRPLFTLTQDHQILCGVAQARRGPYGFIKPVCTCHRHNRIYKPTHWHIIEFCLRYGYTFLGRGCVPPPSNDSLLVQLCTTLTSCDNLCVSFSEFTTHLDAYKYQFTMKMNRAHVVSFYPLLSLDHPVTNAIRDVVFPMYYSPSGNRNIINSGLIMGIYRDRSSIIDSTQSAILSNIEDMSGDNRTSWSVSGFGTSINEDYTITSSNGKPWTLTRTIGFKNDGIPHITTPVAQYVRAISEGMRSLPVCLPDEMIIAVIFYTTGLKLKYAEYLECFKPRFNAYNHLKQICKRQPNCMERYISHKRVFT